MKMLRANRTAGRGRGRAARRGGAGEGSAGGFTLIEILMTMFILGIGLTSIVAVFYGAVRLQQRSTGEVEAAGFARSAEQMLRAKGIREAVLVDGTTPGLLTPFVGSRDWDFPDTGPISNFVVPLPPVLAPAPDAVVQPPYNPNDPPETVSAADQWRLSDRVMPQGVFFFANSFGPQTPPSQDDETDPFSRLAQYKRVRYLWVGFVQDRNPVEGIYDWRVYLFILRTDREDYTVLANTGNWVVANPFDGSTDTSTNLDPFDDPAGRRLPMVVGIPATGVAPTNAFAGLPSILNVDSNDHLFLLHAGDTVLLSNGVIARVVDVQANTIELDVPHQLVGNGQLWFSPSPSPNTESATVMVTTLPSGVIR